MYVRMIWGRLKRGAWNEYVSHYNEAADRITKDVKGFKGRQLLRSTENPDEGMSITVWDNLDALREYDRSQPRTEASRSVDHLHTGEYWVKIFEIESSTL